ncbi:FxsA family protein [Novipirellula artificiosorum]|uniref:Phage T7 F exclusion suppressor FxsA n=1 Tax=Novipirellula artificiosorum TaxID=2528016 RepID=A0A5C6E174_9BACT|nr:FxsA family protein [Novipirellula artificiosorum]TWU42620.1 phage T7 F exclusion suppressor FxsA [Novipirellula artificiosorum]
MFFRLLAAFIIIPLVELALLLRLADATSVAMTLGVVIVTGVIGSMLAKREGVMAWYRFRSALAEGRMPSREIQDGLMVVFAAALLLTPGLLTDGLGFLLLVPAGRDLVRRYVLSRYVRFSDVKVERRSREGSPHGAESKSSSEPLRKGRSESTRWPDSGETSSRNGPRTIDATSFHRKT